MVRLRLEGSGNGFVGDGGFNPTMVRLRRPSSTPIRKSKGVSIPLWCDCDVAWVDKELIDRLVSIPLWCDCDSPPGNCFFCASGVSIPLWCDCDHYWLLCRPAYRQCFNPTMVRLRPKVCSGRHPDIGPVSIPLWCDCDVDMAEIKDLSKIGFNPTMVRLRRL